MKKKIILGTIIASIAILIAICGYFFIVDISSKVPEKIFEGIQVEIREFMSRKVFVISPENYEGSVYSLFSSSASIGSCFSLLFNSFLVNLFNIDENNFVNFHQMIIFYSVLQIIPLIPLSLKYHTHHPL